MLGFGLPLARTFARYFGGDVVTHASVTGTDVVLSLPPIDAVARGGPTTSFSS